MTNRNMARMLVIGLTATVVVPMSEIAVATGPTVGTCTVTQFQMTTVGTKATGLDMASGTTSCWGPYVFFGITPAQLGYPRTTVNDAPELAAVLKRWSTVDGVPGVTQWVNLSPPMASGMKSAGVDPTLFLQWLNEHDGGSPWPSFLPKGTVKDPATVVGGTADRAIQPPSVTPPPQAVPQPQVRPAQASPPVSGKTSVSRSTDPATSDGDATTSSTRPGASLPTGTAATPTAPPSTIRTIGTSMPCVVALPCRQAVRAHDNWQAMPWYEKAGVQVWSHWRWEVGALAMVAVAALGAWAVFVIRRNLAWYGKMRSPR